MPTTTAFSGGAIQYDDADRARLNQYNMMSDFAMRSALQNNAAAQQRAMNQDTIAGQIAQNGTLGQRTGAQLGVMGAQHGYDLSTLGAQQQGQQALAGINNASELARTKLTMGPQQEYADIAKQRADITSPLLQAQTQSELMQNQFKNGVMQSLLGGPAAEAGNGHVGGGPGDTGAASPATAMNPTGGSPGTNPAGGGFLSGLDPASVNNLKLRMVGGMFGIQNPYDPNQAANDITRQALSQAAQTYAGNGDLASVGKITDALRSGNMSGLPQMPGLSDQQLASTGQVQSNLEPLVQAIEGKIGKTWFDLTNNDEATLKQEAMAMKQQLDNARLPPAAKAQIVQNIAARLTAAKQKSGVGPFTAAGSGDTVSMIMQILGAGGQMAAPPAAAGQTASVGSSLPTGM